jgi:hypothetical protein
LFLINSCDNNSSKNDTEQTGKVTVKLSYPSEYLPEMEVFLNNLESHEKFVKRSTMNVSSVMFDKVPEGRYVVYVRTIENLVQPEKGLGETDYDAPLVPAEGGYTENESDYELKEFSLRKNESKNIFIEDWTVSLP